MIKFHLLGKYILSFSRFSQVALMTPVCLLAFSCSPAINQTTQLEPNFTQSVSQSSHIQLADRPSSRPSQSASNKDQLPPKVQSAVLRDAVQRTSRSVAKLRVVQAKKHTWPDGCLGLSEPDVFCTDALVTGWEVVVTDGQRQWTYRTNDRGTVVKLEE